MGFLALRIPHGTSVFETDEMSLPAGRRIRRFFPPRDRRLTAQGF
jgi:hypothetical protein